MNDLLSTTESLLNGSPTKAIKINDMVLPISYVDGLLANNTERAIALGREYEQEEIVCRLLASGMPVDEISVICKIRAEIIRIIERNNASIKIPDYIKKLKARRKSRERTAKQWELFSASLTNKH